MTAGSGSGDERDGLPEDDGDNASTTDLPTRLRSINFDGDLEAARQLRTEAQRTVDQQVASLNDIDSKAIRILRVNVLVVGLILTALSFVSRAESINVPAFLNSYMGFGVLSLILSSAFAALTYTASDLEVGVDPEDVALILERDASTADLEEVVTKSYATWIRFNDRTNVRNTPLITTTVFFVIAAIAYLSLGVYAALIGPIPILLEVITHLALIGVGIATGLPWQVRDACLELHFVTVIIDLLKRNRP